MPLSQGGDLSVPPIVGHLAITHRYFWPESHPYADMLAQIAEATTGKADRVTVLSTAHDPDDIRRRADWGATHGIRTESIDVGDVRTVGAGAKVASHVRYVAWLFQRLMHLRPDVIWVGSTPPMIAGLVAWLVSRLTGSTYVYHLQDIHPEALDVQQRRGRRSPATRIARAIDRRTVEDAAIVVVLSDDMRQTLLDRDMDPVQADIRVINNFVQVPETTEPLRSIRPDQPFVLLFAGRIGPFQRLESVLEVALRVASDEGIAFDIMGDGPCRSDLEAKYGHLGHVRFLGQRPRAEAHAAMCRASCGIVSLLPGITEVAYPSKIIDYGAFGLPIFAMVDPSSELARSLRRQGMAFVPEHDDPHVVAQGLRAFRDRLVAHPPDRDALASDVRRRVSADVVVPQLAALVCEAGMRRR